jgi:predicted metalloendopeptidase
MNGLRPTRIVPLLAALACASSSSSSKNEPQPSASVAPTDGGVAAPAGTQPTAASSAAAGTAQPTAANSPDAGAGLDVEGLDRSVRPGDDFFAFANGGWLKSAEIPADRSTWGAGSMLSELTAKRTAELITDPARGSAPEGSEPRKIGDYYASFMDEATIEQKGLAPLKPQLDAIAAARDRSSLSKAIGQRIRTDVDVLNNTTIFTDNVFGLWIAQDLDDPSKYATFILQGGLSMPDRDYYLAKSDRMADIRTKYQAHIARLLQLAQVPDAEAKAKRIYDLEHRIAEVHASRVETEDVKKGNNHWKRADFDRKAPGLDWKAFFAACGLGNQQDFVVWHPGAVTGISALVKSVPVATWKEYLTYHAIEHSSSYLPAAFVEERFNFNGKVLAGTPKLRERWKRGVTAVDAAMGEAVGKLYVEKYFPPSEKARAEEMVKNEIQAFEKRIDGLDWMDPKTKEQAKAKLSVLKVGVGYPDKWRDYSGLKVVRGDALGNFERSELFDMQWNLSKLGQPVDRGEWVMNPHLVNAVNLPAMNALNFPAAILQPPYFDPNRPQVMDYGSAGAIIGHEISHSFDSQGALFDAKGRLHNWWTESDFAHFKSSSEQLVKQYDQYKPFPDLAVNGEQTLAENIADVAGLSAAYDAYRMSTGGKEAPALSGFTGDQQFFISFAQSWREKIREPALRRQIITDGHAPDEYRADTVRNLDPWYAAFQVAPGQKLFLAPPDRVRVW